MPYSAKGGRGKRAPYDTTHYRIPQPIKPVVEMLANAYRLLCDNEGELDAQNLINKVENTISLSTYPSEIEDTKNEDKYKQKIAVLESELIEARSQLEQARLSEKNFRELFYECNLNSLKAADILKAALKLKSNAGGAIKREIEKVLLLIDDV